MFWFQSETIERRMNSCINGVPYEIRKRTCSVRLVAQWALFLNVAWWDRKQTGQMQFLMGLSERDGVLSASVSHIVIALTGTCLFALRYVPSESDTKRVAHLISCQWITS